MNVLKESFLTGFRATRDAAVARQTAHPATPPTSGGEVTLDEQMSVLRDLKSTAVHVADVLEKRRNDFLAAGDLDGALEQQQKLSAVWDLLQQIDTGGQLRFGVHWTPSAA